MKKKLMIILVMAFLAGITGVNAQVVNNDITTEDTEEFFAALMRYHAPALRLRRTLYVEDLPWHRW